MHVDASQTLGSVSLCVVSWGGCLTASLPAAQGLQLASAMASTSTPTSLQVPPSPDMFFGSPNDARQHANPDKVHSGLWQLHVAVETEGSSAKQERVAAWVRRQREATMEWNFLIIGAASSIQARYGAPCRGCSSASEGASPSEF